MQWATDRELRDLRAALGYLRTRGDRDPAGFGLFGVSRGGTTALLAAAAERDVWGVITDGAFPTSGTMVPYMIRWAESLRDKQCFLRALMPTVAHAFSGLGRPAPHGAAAALPLSQRRIGSGPAGAAALAHDSRSGRHLHQSADRPATCSIRAASPRSSGWSKAPSIIAACERDPRGLRGAGA